MAKFIQIAATQTTEYAHGDLYALDEDGLVWFLEGIWKRLPVEREAGGEAG